MSQIVTTHDLKSHPVPFEEVWQGRKRFEMRWNDREFAVGHVLVLREWRGKSEAARWTGRAIMVLVTHMAEVDGRGLYGRFNVVMSVSPLMRQEVATTWSSW